MTENGTKYKLLGSGDEAVLANIAIGVFDNAVSADRAKSFLAEKHNRIAVAISGDLVVGMATGFVYLHLDKPPQLFINEVGVAPPYQRQGIATELVNLLLASARASGCSEAWVATELSNVDARALYESLDGDEDDDMAVVYTFPVASKPAG
ncbi:MAG: GNAT family N-acetyltransferase [Aureliella sp.]